MATVTIRIVQKGAASAQVAIRRLANELGEAVIENDRRIIQMGRNIQEAGRSLTFGLTLPIAALGAASVKSAVGLDSLHRGLVTVTGSAEEAQRQLRELEGLARLPGLGFAQVIRGATQLQAAGLGEQLSIDALREFGNALAAVGRGKADLDGVIRALTQISAKGRVLGQEINQLAERVPQIRVVMKEAFGTASSEEIQAMGIEADEFITRVVAAMGNLERATSGAQNTFENLGDAMLKAGDAFGRVVLPVLLPVIRGMTDLLEAMAALPVPIRATMIAMAAFVAVLGPAILIVGKMVTAVGALNIAMRTATGAAVLGRLSTLLVPGGAVLGGLSLLAAGFISARNASVQAADAVARFNRSAAAQPTFESVMQARAAALDRMNRARRSMEAAGGRGTTLGDNFFRLGQDALAEYIRLEGVLREIKDRQQELVDAAADLTNVVIPAEIDATKELIDLDKDRLSIFQQILRARREMADVAPDGFPEPTFSDHRPPSIDDMRRAGLSVSDAAFTGELGRALTEFFRLQQEQEQWTLVLQGNKDALQELVKSGTLTQEQADKLATSLRRVATEAELMAQQIIVGLGGAIEALIISTDRMAETLIRAASRMIETTLVSRGFPILGTLLGTVGGIAAAITGRQNKPQPVSIDSYSSRSLSQLQANRQDRPQLVTLQFVDPRTGQVTEETHANLLRLEERDAVQRTTTGLLPTRRGR